MEFIDLKAQYLHLKSIIDKNIEETLDNAHFILSDMVKEFENNLADYLGVKYAVSCSDGTAALQLIYMAYEIGIGDAVFCPDMTFIASIEPACLLGATPVFCDINKTTYNLDVESLERQIKEVIAEGKLCPKAIVAVDFVGNPADYVNISKVATRYNLLLIEDAAQGIGAEYQGKKCGSLGHISATSFFPSKPLGCYGDGGAVFTNDDKMNSLLRSLRVHGKGKTKYDNERIGINSRLDSIQAAVLLAKLEELPREILKRQEIAQYYKKKLENDILTPNIQLNNISSYAQYILVGESPEQRKKILTALNQNNIPSILYYPTPMHRLPVFKNINNYNQTFTNADWYSECSFGIPFSPYLLRGDQDRVIDVILDTLR